MPSAVQGSALAPGAPVAPPAPADAALLAQLLQRLVDGQERGLLEARRRWGGSEGG